MSSDRGTIHRGISAGSEQQAPWPEPTAPAGRRPPSATRERKPVLAVLALLLIAGGALGGLYLVTQNAKRVAAIEITQQISAGQKIPLGAMQQVQIAANSGVNYVPWSEASQVAQFYAGNAIPPGTLLNGAMVVRASSLTSGKDVLGLALKDGQVPGNLQVGDHIDIYDVSNANESCPGTPGSTLSANAVVLAVNVPAANSGSSVAADLVVAVTPGTAGQVACNASNGVVGVAVLPGGGQQASTTPSAQGTQPGTVPGTRPRGKRARPAGPAAGSSPSAPGSPSPGSPSPGH
jgi:hypothetical protein